MNGFSLPQAIKYFSTSLLTFCLNLLVIWFLVVFLKTFYLLAVALGFGTETTLLYFLNRAWTFRGVVRTTAGGGYARAWVVALSTLGLVLALERFFVGFVGFDYMVARLLVAPFAYAWSYLLDASFTFAVVRFTRE